MSDVKENPWSLTSMARPTSTGHGDPNSPAFQTAECLEMMRDSEVCRDLRKGTRWMKKNVTKYLPRYENEDEEDYKNRVMFSSFRNFYGKAVRSILGKVFSKPPMLNKDVPERIADELKDADLNGNDWTIVAEQWFNCALDEGISWLLVDYHTVDNAGDLSIQQERELGVRPYWVVIPQHQVLGVDYSKRGEVYTITRFRYWVWEKVPDGLFGQKFVFRIYMYEPEKVTVFERVEEADKDNPSGYRIVKETPITLGMVPVTPLNLEQTGPFEAKPPLEDLAEMNIEHFQIRSDQRRALSVASFPMLGVFGASLDASVRMGPMQAYAFEDPKASMRWIESTGIHLAAGRTELKDLEDAIRTFALSFETPGMYATATAVNVDATDSVAPIIRWAFRMRDALAVCLYYHAQWLKMADGGTVDVDTSFIKSMLTVETLKVLLEALKEGSLTKETFLQRLKEYGLFSDKFDPKAEVDELMRVAEEAMAKAEEAMAKLNKEEAPTEEEPEANGTNDDD